MHGPQMFFQLVCTVWLGEFELAIDNSQILQPEQENQEGSEKDEHMKIQESPDT